METDQWLRYQSSIQLVIDYIHENPRGPVDNDTLASIACLSTYHWHRIYRAITGETAVQTVRAVRMHRAAADLLRTENSIAHIGLSVGYPSVQSFTRAFTAYYGLAPGKFRSAALNRSPKAQQQIDSPLDYEVEVLDHPEMCLVGLWHYGDYSTVGRSFEKVFAATASMNNSYADSLGVGVYLQDPLSVENTASLKSFAGTVVKNESIEIPPGLSQYLIPATRSATLTFQGPYALLEQPYCWLYSDWLPTSGLELDDHPAYEIYVSNPKATAPQDSVTKICIPVAR